jgi:DNA polymerase-3 subunit epsilon
VHESWAARRPALTGNNTASLALGFTYLVTQSGLFHDAHRDLDDCYATLEILARQLPATSTTALGALLDRARRKTFRIWAGRGSSVS